MQKKSKKWMIIFGVVIVIIVVILVVSSSGSNGQDNLRATVKVERKNIVDKALAVGSIEPVNEIDVCSVNVLSPLLR